MSTSSVWKRACGCSALTSRSGLWPSLRSRHRTIHPAAVPSVVNGSTRSRGWSLIADALRWLVVAAPAVAAGRSARADESDEQEHGDDQIAHQLLSFSDVLTQNAA